jgi:hypothetical protein
MCTQAWIKLIHDRIHCWAVTNMVMNFKFSLKSGQLLNELSNYKFLNTDPQHLTEWASSISLTTYVIHILLVTG